MSIRDRDATSPAITKPGKELPYQALDKRKDVHETELEWEQFGKMSKHPQGYRQREKPSLFETRKCIPEPELCSLRNLKGNSDEAKSRNLSPEPKSCTQDQDHAKDHKSESAINCSSKINSQCEISLQESGTKQPVGKGILGQIEVKSSNLGSSTKGPEGVTQSTTEISVEKNDHEGQTDRSIGFVLTKMADGKEKYSICSTTNNHMVSKRTESTCYHSKCSLSQLTLLAEGDLLCLETGQVENGPSGRFANIYLIMITKPRTTMQRLMVFKCPVPSEEIGKPVRLFISNSKKALGILKLHNKLSILTRLGEPGYASNLAKNYSDIPMEPTRDILDLAIVEKQFEDPLSPDLLYVGSISRDWLFTEDIFDKKHNRLVRRLNVQFGSLHTVAGGRFIGMHYSPFLKNFENHANLCRITLFVDLGDQVAINVAICSREVEGQTSTLSYQGQFVFEKREYGLEGPVEISFQEDPYNQLKVFVVGKRLEALVCLDISYRVQDALVNVQKIQIAGPGAPKLRTIDWVEPSALQTVSGMMTMLCDNRQTVVHIRRVNGPACLEDIILPRVTHLDRLLADDIL